MSHTPCPICREHHETDRGLSYDGKGINACGMYRNRLATFQSNAPEHLGPLFAAAPELLAACKLSLRNVESLIHFFPVNGEPNEKRSLETWADMLRSAIAKAEGR